MTRPGRYLITGGGGNLARQLAARFLADGADVVLFDLSPQPPETRIAGCTYVTGDVTRAEDVTHVFETHRPTRVLHMASLLSARSEQDRALAWRVNATAGFELFEAALRHGVERFFFPSTCATYGGTLPDPLPPDHPQWPEGLYGVTKVANERMGFYYHAKHGLDFRCIRLPLVISRHAPAGAASAYGSRAFIEAVERGRYTFPVRPESRVSTIYVKDVLAGMQALVAAPRAALSRCDYNVHAFAPSAEELARAIQARRPGFTWSYAPESAVVKLIDSWPSQIIDEPARSDWGWNPRFDLQRTVDDFLTELQ